MKSVQFAIVSGFLSISISISAYLILDHDPEDALVAQKTRPSRSIASLTLEKGSQEPASEPFADHRKIEVNRLQNEGAVPVGSQVGWVKLVDLANNKMESIFFQEMESQVGVFSSNTSELIKLKSGKNTFQITYVSGKTKTIYVVK